MATPNSTFLARDETGDDDLEVGGDFCDLDLDLFFLFFEVVGVTVTVGRDPTEDGALVDGPLLILRLVAYSRILGATMDVLLLSIVRQFVLE